MSKLIKKTEFEKVTNGLWKKVKDNFAKINGNNVFTQKNSFENDVVLTSNNTYIGESTNSGNAGGNKRMGRRDYTSHSNGNDGYVKSLIIKASNNTGASNQQNFSVWAVKKKSTNLEDSDITQIVTSEQSIAKGYSNWGICYEVKIDRNFEDEVFFVYQVDGNNSDRLSYRTLSSNSSNNIYLEENKTDVNATNLNGHTAQHTGVYGIIGGTDVRSKLKKLKDEAIKLDSNGKLELSIIPDLALNEFHSVASKDEAMQMIQNSTIRSGDVVIIRDDNNSLHMYNGATGTDFDSSFIEIVCSNGTVKSVNNEIANEHGNVVLGAQHIPATGGTVQEVLNKKIENINGVTTQNGSVTLNGSNINANVNSQNKTIQQHLIDNDAAIRELQRTRHKHSVGEMVVAFNKPHSFGQDNEFRVDNVTYIWCGGNNKYITRTKYPQLAAALGKSDERFLVPHIADIQDVSSNSQRCHFVCAKIE